MQSQTIGYKFGVVPKHGMVYCSCKSQCLKAYMLALIFPVILTGLIPIIFVTIWKPHLDFLFAVMVSGERDLMMLRADKIRQGQLIMDHPNAPLILIISKGQEPEGFVKPRQSKNNS